MLDLIDSLWFRIFRAQEWQKFSSNESLLNRSKQLFGTGNLLHS
jgi:hypothetical protein